VAGFATLVALVARSQHFKGWCAFPAMVALRVLLVGADLALLLVTAALFLTALSPCRRPIDAEAALTWTFAQRRCGPDDVETHSGGA
jgi:hypothetical protein